MKTRKVKQAGRFGTGYGIRIRKRLREVEEKQRKKQICPFCRGKVKRLAKGIWRCNKCKRKFASGTFYLE